MHILELPANVRDELFTTAVAPMQVNVLMTTKAKTVTGYDPDGTPQYSTTYSSVTWPLTNRLRPNRKISLEYSKPYLPLDGGDNIIKAGRVVLDLTNTDEAFALEQAGAILSPNSLEQSRVNLELNVNGQQFPLFRGKVYGGPGEFRGRTTIVIRDVLWSCAREAVTFERFDPSQSTYMAGGSLNANPVSAGGAEYYDAITVWTQDAVPATSVTNENAEEVGITRINVANGAKLGKYTIEFLSGGFFNMTYPDNTIPNGTLTQNFTSPYVDIPQSAWIVPNAQILGGKRIEFFVYKIECNSIYKL
jgi:hypothetical protein